MPTAVAQLPAAAGRAAAPSAPGSVGSFLSSLLDIVNTDATNAAPDAKPGAPASSLLTGTPLTSSPRKGGKEKEASSNKQDDNTSMAVPVATPVTDASPVLLRLLQFGLNIGPRIEKSTGTPVERSSNDAAAAPKVDEEQQAEPQTVAAPPTDLSFALRLTDASQSSAPTPAGPVSNDAQPQPPQSSQPSSPTQPVSPVQPAAPVQPVRAAQPADSSDNDKPATKQQSHEDAPAAAAKTEQPAAPAPTVAIAPSTPPASTPVTAPVKEPTPVAHTAPTVNEPLDKPVAAAPAQRISLTVSDSQNKPVEVHLMERAGEVRVSVRAADETMSHSMRADLGSLNGKLAQSGYNAESYTPAMANGGGASNERQSSDGRESSAGGRQNSQQNQSGGQQQSSRDGRGQRPAWVEELENSLASSAAIRSNTPWRQA